MKPQRRVYPIKPLPPLYETKLSSLDKQLAVLALIFAIMILIASFTNCGSAMLRSITVDTAGSLSVESIGCGNQQFDEGETVITGNIPEWNIDGGLIGKAPLQAVQIKIRNVSGAIIIKETVSRNQGVDIPAALQATVK